MSWTALGKVPSSDYRIDLDAVNSNVQILVLINHFYCFFVRKWNTLPEAFFGLQTSPRANLRSCFSQGKASEAGCFQREWWVEKLTLDGDFDSSPVLSSYVLSIRRAVCSAIQTCCAKYPGRLLMRCGKLYGLRRQGCCSKGTSEPNVLHWMTRQLADLAYFRRGIAPTIEHAI